MPEQAAIMAQHHTPKLNPYAFGLALGAVFLVIAQVQALEHVHTHSKSHHHDRSPWDSPSATSLMQRLHNQAGATGSRRVSADSYHDVFRQSREETSPAEMMVLPKRSAVTTRSRQEMDALISFRANISDSGMIFRNWDANDSTPCSWKGVLCSSNLGHVVSLNLPSWRLEGNMNSELLALSKLPLLQKLDLSDNSFTGFISGPSLLNFSSLAVLNLSYNQVSGDIPMQIGDVPNLQQLILAGNSLSGTVPPSICNCSLLMTLNLESNLLVSHIPNAIGRLKHLQEINLGTSIPHLFLSPPLPRNQILGPVPSSLGNCSSLRVLLFQNNPTLKGRIPQELGLLHSLQELSLFNCNLEGAFPRWIVNLTDLVHVGLSYNQLHGSIPPEIGRLSNASTLILDDNFLEGSIPPEIGNCTSLTILEVADNLIGGVVPSSLQQCRLLKFLSFAENPGMGPQLFPSWITSLTNLEYLILPEVNLHGKIPDDIGRLSNLQQFSVDGNQLTGSIPSSFSNCSLLSFLTFSFNNLTGHVPSNIGLLSNLLDFEISITNLTGSIPSSITNLTQLLFFIVTSNSLGGTIDGQWGLLSELQYFIVSRNQFVGSIPKTLSNCSNLFTLSLHNNQLIGEIPATFGNLSQLVHFSASFNRISGKVPTSLGKCSFLSFLDLSTNRLEGTLPNLSGSALTSMYLDNNNFIGATPNSLASLTELVEVDLSQNQFNGSILEKTISRFTTLTYINLSCNLLSGALSASWSRLLNLQTIDISSNNISGSIPSLRQLKGLQTLDLSWNNFSGELPQELASLPQLVFFNASYNGFVGKIPSSKAFDSNFTVSSFLGNPRLCGELLGSSRACPYNASKSQSGDHCKGFLCARVWKPTLVAAIVCTFLVAVVIRCSRRGCSWTGCCMRSRAAKESAERNEILQIVENSQQNFPKVTAANILGVVGDNRNKVGSGSWSSVYKGSLPGWGVVAIKTFVGCHEDEGMNSMPSNVQLWWNLLEREAKLQASLRHRNILEVLSFCASLEFRALLLEYMPQGSLERHLYPIAGSSNTELSKANHEDKDSNRSCALAWGVHLGIAKDIAEGLKYLHHDCPKPLIHGDLKPSNILLDDDMMAKIADFGISRFVSLCQGDCGEASVSKFCGTIGYIPPEYALVTSVSTKGDVFSYGIILFEMLSGLSPKSGPGLPEVNYRDWHLYHFQNSLLELLDPTLKQECRMDATKSKQMLLLAKVAFFCTRENPQSRPNMNDVLLMLIQIQELGAKTATRKTMLELLAPEDEEPDVSYKNTWEYDNPNAAAVAYSVQVFHP